MKIKKIILSVLALANVILVPVFDVWGGLFPSNPDNNFLDVVEYVFEGEVSYWVVLFTLTIFIPSLFMLIFSFSDGSKMFKAASGAGIIFMIITLIRFVSQNDFGELFDFDDGNISIGTWIALSLFIISFFAVKSRNDKQFKPNKKYIDNLNNAYASNVTSTPTVDSPKMKFCPECGSKMEASAMFCGSCGFKINK